MSCVQHNSNFERKSCCFTRRLTELHEIPQTTSHCQSATALDPNICTYTRLNRTQTRRFCSGMKIRFSHLPVFPSFIRSSFIPHALTRSLIARVLKISTRGESIWRALPRNYRGPIRGIRFQQLLSLILMKEARGSPFQSALSKKASAPSLL